MNVSGIELHTTPSGLRYGLGVLITAAFLLTAALAEPSAVGVNAAGGEAEAVVARQVAALMALELADALANCGEKEWGALSEAYATQLKKGGGITFEDAAALHALAEKTVEYFRSRWRPLEEERRRQFKGRLLEDGSVVRPWHPSGEESVREGPRRASSGERRARLVLADGSGYVLPLNDTWFTGWEKHGFGGDACWEALVSVDSFRMEAGVFLAGMGIGEVTVQWGPGLPAGGDAADWRRLRERAEAVRKNDLPAELAGSWSVLLGQMLAKRHWAFYRNDYDPARLEELIAEERRELERWRDDEERKERLQTVCARLGEAYGKKILKREREMESRFLKDHAGRPGVMLLPRGVQCVVEPGDDRLEEVDSAAVMTGVGCDVSYAENGASFGFLPDFVRQEAGRLPKGRSWTFWIPGSAFEWTQERQQSDQRELLLDELAPAQRAHRLQTRGDDPPTQETGRLLRVLKVWKSAREKAAH